MEKLSLPVTVVVLLLLLMVGLGLVLYTKPTVVVWLAACATAPFKTADLVSMSVTVNEETLEDVIKEISLL
jgi:hypothetical protein